MFPNLNAEMARQKLTIKALSTLTDINYESLKNKVSGATEFKRSEMYAIKRIAFPNLSIDYLFAEIGVNRVGISHAVKNPASGRVAQKCGLTFEGTKREYFKTLTGEFLDISDYGIIRSEWENIRQIK